MWRFVHAEKLSFKKKRGGWRTLGVIVGVDFFYLWGDTVTLNVKSFTAFCDELIARNLPIQWFGNARADNLTDPAFVHRLKRAGCWMLALGIETESDEVRKDMVKRLESQKIEAAFMRLSIEGLTTRSSMRKPPFSNITDCLFQKFLCWTENFRGRSHSSSSASL